jgi:hypothetical protein
LNPSRASSKETAVSFGRTWFGFANQTVDLELKTEFWIAGSFVTDKARPDDLDVWLWVWPTLSQREAIGWLKTTGMAGLLMDRLKTGASIGR